MTAKAVLRTGGAAALSLITIAVAAQAQTRTTATYDDWTLRCEQREGPPPVKSCEMVQSATTQGQAQPIANIAIGRASKTDPMKIAFQLPINVWLPSAVKLVYDDKEQPLVASFKRCIPAGCFADADLTADLVRKLRARTVNGKFEFKDSGQRDIAIPISFKGFGTAYDALAKD
jgi:invasion protein IalB